MNTAKTGANAELDVVIVGAGLAGLHALYRMRELGLSARIIEAGDGVGGTWYWNRYPGARCDSPSHVYQYFFSEDLLREWKWSERFPAQPEVLEYLNFVAERFGLFEDIQFSTRVDSAHFDDDAARWNVTTDKGESFSARYFLSAIGGLTVPSVPDIPGLDSYKGKTVHTCKWPKDGVEYRGKRVAVIGTGATGIQVIQTIAPEVESLTVYQRTPNYAIPIRNPKLGEKDWNWIAENGKEIQATTHQTFSGFEYNLDERSALELDPEARRAALEELWADGSLKFWVGNFADILASEEANAPVAEFVREKIRARIDDPVTAEKLLPTGFPYGSRRVPLENGYFETYNRDNVSLIDINEDPMEAFTNQGIRTASGEREFDLIIFATGFDAVTGGYSNIDIRGSRGQSLQARWSERPSAYLGVQVSGFPNLFMVTGPTAPSVAFCNYPTCAAMQVEWITDCIKYMRQNSLTSIDAKADAEKAWVDHVHEAASMTLIPGTKSWWMGSNIEGKQVGVLSYIGGAPEYKRLCDEEAENRYEGFSLA